jgi:hypothetical protein
VTSTTTPDAFWLRTSYSAGRRMPKLRSVRFSHPAGAFPIRTVSVSIARSPATSAEIGDAGVGDSMTGVPTGDSVTRVSVDESPTGAVPVHPATARKNATTRRWPEP